MVTPDLDQMSGYQRTAYAEALIQIEAARKTGATHLSLWAHKDDSPLMHLTHLPPEIATLSNVTLIDLDNTRVSDITPLRGLAGLRGLNLTNTQVSDLRVLLDLDLLWDKAGQKLPEPLSHITGGIWFQGIPMTQADKRLRDISEFKRDKTRASKLRTHLHSLPPWPEPLPWEVPEPGNAPAHRSAPLQTVFQDDVMQAVAPGSALQNEIDLRARQGWAALLDYLADFTDQRARIVNQLPALAKAFDGLHRALGDDYEAINPVQLGMQAERLIRLSKRAGEMLMTDDAEDVSEFTLQLARYLPRFPVWQDYLRDAEDEDAARVQRALDDLRAMNRSLQQDAAISDTVTEIYGEVLDAVEDLPEDNLMALGGRTATFEILLTVAEKAKEEADAAKKTGLLHEYRKEVRSTRMKTIAKGQVAAEMGTIGVAADLLLNNAQIITRVAKHFPEHAPYVLQVLHYLGWV